MTLAATRGLRQAVLDGECLIGAMLSDAAPWLVEMAALAGFDFITLDLEHEVTSPQAAVAAVRAADAFGVPIVVRTHCDDRTQALLNAGVAGIQVPGVSTAPAAQHVVDTTRFHPLGRRGYTVSTRSAMYGLGQGEREYMSDQNQHLLVVAMLEDIAVVDVLDEILACDGIDAFHIGPGDLAQSMGFPEASVVQRVIHNIMDQVVEAGRPVGVGAYAGTDPSALLEHHRRGARLITVVLNRIIAAHLRDVRRVLADAVRYDGT